MENLIDFLDILRRWRLIMPKLVSMETDSGKILVEAELSGAKLEEMGMIDGAFEKLEGSFKSVSETINRCSINLAELFNEQYPISKCMTRAEIEFGIKVNAEGNAYVAKTSGEANITVKLNWDFTQKG